MIAPFDSSNGVGTSATTIVDREIAIACRGIVKDFGEGNTKVRALHGIDVDVFSSELTLLVGPSGCGKTTLISIIAGLLNPTAGDLELFRIKQ